MQPRKLEYFEDQLKDSAPGREVLALMRAHADEIMYLVNKNRPTMICWQRHHGPVFIKSVVDSGFEEDITFVKEVKGVTIDSLMLYMAEVLQDNGSPALKNTVGNYISLVLKIVKEVSSLKEVIQIINSTQIMEQHG